MSYKTALYDSYVTSHIADRKGAPDRSALAAARRVFDQHFGALLPARRSRAADLGCGPGTLVAWLKTKGFDRVFGVDFSAEQVANAHAIGVHEVRQGDLFDFLATEREFDLLVARDVIEHFDKQMVFDFLQACRGALAPGGRLLLQVPNAESPYFGRVRYGDFTHEVAFSASSVKQVLAAAGFSRVSVHPWRPARLGARSWLRYLVWRVLEPLIKLPIVVESGGRDRIVTMNLIVAAEVGR